MSEDWQKYVADPRTVCKYGLKCYQKNPEHHATYKHPPQIVQKHANRMKNRFSPYTRKITSPNIPKDSSNDADIENSATSISNIEDSSNLEPTCSGDLNAEPQKEISLKIPKDVTFYSSTSDPVKFKELFLVEMPADFFSFFDYLNENGDIEKVLSSVNLELIGPYELLLGKLPVVDSKELYLIHWRFFYDPPEFQSVLKRKGKSEYHIGYFRDDPNEKPGFVGSNDSAKDCRITLLSQNIFAAVNLYLQEERKRSVFSAQPCKKLMDKLTEYAEKHNISLKEFKMKDRQGKVVTKTFHGAGIIVPVNKKTELGYRKLVESDAIVKKMFSKLEAAKSQSEKDAVLTELQPVITYASIAVDECDFGTGLEVGIDLFCSGLKELELSALSSLTAVYPLLNREQFGQIIQAHLKYRRKGPNMSLLSLSDS